MKSNKWGRVVVGTALCIGAVGCDAGGGAGACAIGFGVENTSPSDNFRWQRDRFFVQHLQFNPVTATYLGADGYPDAPPALRESNGALRDYSEDALTKELAFYRETQQALSGIDRAQLEPALRVDYKLMNAQLAFLIHRIRYSKWPTQAITYNLGKNAIVDLREAYKAKMGTAYSPKNFHEKFMRMGTVPVSYFREMFLM